MIPRTPRPIATWELCGCGHSATVKRSRLTANRSHFGPHYAATHLNLGYALKDSGRLDEAAAEWEQTLRLAPGDTAVRHELMRIGRSFAQVGG